MGIQITNGMIIRELSTRMWLITQVSQQPSFPHENHHVPCEHHHNPCENHHFFLSKMATQKAPPDPPGPARSAVRMTPAGSTLQGAQEALLQDLVFFGEMDSDGSHFGEVQCPRIFITPGPLVDFVCGGKPPRG